MKEEAESLIPADASMEPRRGKIRGTTCFADAKTPKYVHGYIDCRGRPRWYLRRPGFKRIPLSGLPWSPEFMAAYEAGDVGRENSAGQKRHQLGGVADLITIYYQTAAFLQLADATRQTYRGILERFRAEYGDQPVAFLEEQHIWAILDKERQRLRRPIICAACYARS